MLTVRLFHVLTSDENTGALFTSDGISYLGKLWLVPEWYSEQGKEFLMPERIIRFDHLPHQAVPFAGHDYIVTYSIPKVCYKTPSPLTIETGHEVVLRPEVQILRGHS